MPKRKSKRGQKLRKAAKQYEIPSKSERLKRDRYFAEQMRLIREQLRGPNV